MIKKISFQFLKFIKSCVTSKYTSEQTWVAEEKDTHINTLIWSKWPQTLEYRVRKKVLEITVKKTKKKTKKKQT